MQAHYRPPLESQAGFFFNQGELVRVFYKALSSLGLSLDELGYCAARSQLSVTSVTEGIVPPLRTTVVLLF